MSAHKEILISNIAVIDVEKDTVYPNQYILIRGNTIEEISGSPMGIAGDPKIKTIDGANKFLLPALWDMHVHLTRQAAHVAYPQFIAHGITHVRDMRGAYNNRDPFAGVQHMLEGWNREVESHSLIGPRLHGYTSFAVEGPHPMFKKSPSFFNCTTPDEAKKLVQYFDEKKVTLIKMYDNIPRDAFFTLMQEAKKRGLEVAGHKPLRVSTIEASNAGMKSLDHARFFLWDSYPGGEALRKEENPKKSDHTWLRQKMLLEHDSLLLKEMFGVMKKNNTWYCPTHLTRKSDAFAEDKAFRGRYAHINPILRFLSFEDLDATLQEDPTPIGRKVYRDFYVKGLEISNEAYKNGLKLLAGSDVPELPGSSLHDELEELSKAGLPNFEVLRTATVYPAQYYGLHALYGSIKKGKRADLLILSANPLEKIENTKRIAGVIFDGKHLDEAALTSLRYKLNKRENGIGMHAKLIWDMLMYLTI